MESTHWRSFNERSIITNSDVIHLPGGKFAYCLTIGKGLIYTWKWGLCWSFIFYIFNFQLISDLHKSGDAFRQAERQLGARETQERHSGVEHPGFDARAVGRLVGEFIFKAPLLPVARWPTEISSSCRKVARNYNISLAGGILDLLRAKNRLKRTVYAVKIVGKTCYTAAQWNAKLLGGAWLMLEHFKKCHFLSHITLIIIYHQGSRAWLKSCFSFQKRSWSKSPSERPQFTEIYEEMTSIIQEVSSESVSQHSQDKIEREEWSVPAILYF